MSRRLPLIALGLALLAFGASLEAQGTRRSSRSSRPARKPLAALEARPVNPAGPFATLTHTVDQDSLLAHSRSLLGVRYVWAGESRTGVDCSGLVRVVFRAMGLDLPHNAAMLATRGTSVPADTAHMRPGDLIVFSKARSTRISHVGIYMGNGTMLHASSYKKQVVEVPLSSYDTGLRLRDVRRVAAVAPSANDGND